MAKARDSLNDTLAGTPAHVPAGRPRGGWLAWAVPGVVDGRGAWRRVGGVPGKPLGREFWWWGTLPPRRRRVLVAVSSAFAVLVITVLGLMIADLAVAIATDSDAPGSSPWVEVVFEASLLLLFLAGGVWFAALAWAFWPPAVGRHIAGRLLARGECPACRYELGGVSPDADRLTTCPECGAAWRS